MGKSNRKTDKRRAVFSGKRILSALFFLLAVIIAGILCYRYMLNENEERRFRLLQEEKQDGGIRGLKKKYKDMVGWIEINGTEFSYPVMQTRDDPEFYLHRDEKGEYSFYGTPFLDSRCSLDSDNLIIYGHNINGRRYFGYLHYFKESSFYKNHKELTFTKVGGVEEKYPVIAVIKTDIYSDYYKYTDIYNDEEYRDFAKKVLDNSLYRCRGADALEKEMKEETVEAFFHKYQFLTLSTCRIGEGKDARLLVVGCRKR